MFVLEFQSLLYIVVDKFTGKLCLSINLKIATYIVSCDKIEYN
jgi:hypothetical protein